MVSLHWFYHVYRRILFGQSQGYIRCLTDREAYEVTAGKTIFTCVVVVVVVVDNQVLILENHQSIIDVLERSCFFVPL